MGANPPPPRVPNSGLWQGRAEQAAVPPRHQRPGLPALGDESGASVSFRQTNVFGTTWGLLWWGLWVVIVGGKRL